LNFNKFNWADRWAGEAMNTSTAASPGRCTPLKMTFRKNISLLFFLLFTLTTTFGQGKKTNLDKSVAMLSIRNSFQEINSYTKYKIVTVDEAEEFLEHNPDNGASLKGYYKSDSLKKIIEWLGLSNKVIQNEYYFDNGKLIFVYTKESKYKFIDSTQSFDYSKLLPVFQGRYYFSNEKLFETKLTDKEHYQSKEQDALNFLDTSKKFTKVLNAKRT
jgi:hypothetical protein